MTDIACVRQSSPQPGDVTKIQDAPILLVLRPFLPRPFPSTPCAPVVPLQPLPSEPAGNRNPSPHVSNDPVSERERPVPCDRGGGSKQPSRNARPTWVFHDPRPLPAPTPRFQDAEGRCVPRQTATNSQRSHTYPQRKLSTANTTNQKACPPLRRFPLNPPRTISSPEAPSKAPRP